MNEDMAAEHRIFLPEPTVRAQIERAIFELERNLYYYLQRNPDAKVRAARIDEISLAKAVGPAGKRMLHYLNTVAELADLKVLETTEPQLTL